ncbi:hypothetical protein [Paenibacillus urinalis]|uniref:hypothetical protein n=1 Tax=Paenibacillus urinalis TaxID=521520 RepID=UPI00362C7B5F
MEDWKIGSVAERQRGRNAEMQRWRFLCCSGSEYSVRSFLDRDGSELSIRKPSLSKYERCRFSLNISLPPQVEPQVEAALPSQTGGGVVKSGLAFASRTLIWVGSLTCVMKPGRAERAKRVKSGEVRCKSWRFLCCSGSEYSVDRSWTGMAVNGL